MSLLKLKKDKTKKLDIVTYDADKASLDEAVSKLIKTLTN